MMGSLRSTHPTSCLLKRGLSPIVLPAQAIRERLMDFLALGRQHNF
jgi:hypothetical protein